MASSKNTTTSRPVCKFPGCEQPAAPADGPGRPPEYCTGRPNRITALGADLRDRIDGLADPTAAEAEVKAVRAAAEQRAATAEAKAGAAERAAARGDRAPRTRR